MDSQQETPSAPSPSDKPVRTDVGDENYQSAQKVLTSYLLERSEVFRRLSDLQKQASTDYTPMCICYPLVWLEVRFVSNCEG